MAKDTTFLERKPSAHESGEERWARWLLKVVDVALAGCIFVVPLLFGGRCAVGHFGLAFFAATAASAWWLRQTLLPRQYWRRSAGHLLLLAAIGLVVLQLTPLPTSWMSQVAPKTAELLPLWNADASAGFGAWSQVSLTPVESRTGLVLFLACAMIFWVTVQRIRSMEDVELLLKWVAFSAIGMAVFGLLQNLTSNGKFFWVYQHPFAEAADGAKGAFTNRNHFAHFLALGIGPVIWWVQDGLRRHGAQNGALLRLKGMRNQAAILDIGLRVTGLVVVFLGILMSLSRGGAMAAGAAALVSVTVCYWAGSIRGKSALGLTAVALLLGGFLLGGDDGSLGGRLEGMAESESIQDIDKGRQAIWTTTLAAIPDFGRLGSGIGSFREVYPLYMEHRHGHTIFTHAENGYLQVTLEAGYLGLVLVLLAVLIGAFWSGRGLLRANSARSFVAVGAVTATMLASVVHSGVDFVWYVPGCLVVTMMLIACGCRMCQFTHNEERRTRDRIILPRPVAWMAASSVMAIGVWMVATQVGPMRAESHWISYQRLHRASVYLNPPTAELPDQGVFPDDPRVLADREAAAREQVRKEELEIERRLVTELAEVVRLNPNHARAQLALAGGYKRLFEFAQEKAINQMPLSSIRDGALGAKYASSEELEEWLTRAVGKKPYRLLKLSLHHAKIAVALSPLQGEGYQLLGELCFLDVEHKAETWDFVDQALRVRPYDGTVLFHAGREACLANRFDEGVEFWVKSFACGPIYQRQLIDWTAGRLDLESLLETFQPDLETLQYMQSRYKTIAEPGQLTPLFEAIARASQKRAEMEFNEGNREEAAERWLDAMSACQNLDRSEDAAVCGKQAVECNSHSFDARYRLGFLLAKMGRYVEADEHLSWCRRTKPGHIKTKRRLTEVQRMLIDPEARDPRRFGITYPPGTSYMEASLKVPNSASRTTEPLNRDNGAPQSMRREFRPSNTGQHTASTYPEPQASILPSRGGAAANLSHR